MFLRLFCASLTLLLALNSGAARPAVADDVYTLRVATWGSPVHPQVTQWVPLFTKEVETNSHGRIKVDYFPAASLVKEQDVASAIPGDVADISLLVIEDMSGLDSALGIWGSPLMKASFDQFFAAMHPGTALFKATDAKLQAHGAMLLSAIDIGPPVFVSKDPLRTPADFAGKNIRAFSGSSGKLIAQLGAAPTQLNQNDVYAALSTGTVQSAYGGLGGIFGSKLYEVTKYVDVPGPMFGSLINGYTMNLHRFQTLPPDLQKVVLDAAAKANVSANAANKADYGSMLADMVKRGCTQVNLDPNAYKTQVNALINRARAEYPASDPLVKALLQAFPQSS
jgi:TRAP-type C4-dicarboxylate transport system substrate-binding protein